MICIPFLQCSNHPIHPVIYPCDWEAISYWARAVCTQSNQILIAWILVQVAIELKLPHIFFGGSVFFSLNERSHENDWQLLKLYSYANLQCIREVHSATDMIGTSSNFQQMCPLSTKKNPLMYFADSFRIRFNGRSTRPLQTNIYRHVCSFYSVEVDDPLKAWF